MSSPWLAAVSGIALGNAVGVSLVIALIVFGVVKLFGGAPRTRWHKRGAVGAGEEQLDPDDGTPHTFDT